MITRRKEEEEEKEEEGRRGIRAIRTEGEFRRAEETVIKGKERLHVKKKEEEKKKRLKRKAF